MLDGYEAGHPPLSFVIGQLIAQSHITPDDKQIIDVFSMRDIVMDAQDGYLITIDKVEIANASGENRIHWGNLSEMFNFDGVFVAEKAELIGFLMKLRTGFNVSIDRIEVLSNALSAEDDGRYHIRGRVQDWLVSGFDLSTGGFGAMLSGVNVEQLRINIDIDGKTAGAAHSGEQYVDETNVLVAIDDLVEIKSSSRVAFSKDLVTQLESATLVGDEEAAGALVMGSIMAAPIELDLSLTIDDKGLLEAIFADEEAVSGASREQSVAVVLQQMNLMFGGFVPSAMEQNKPVLEAWLLEGGVLKISISPEGPISVADILASQVGGNFDQAWQSLGLKIEHN